MLLKHHLLAPLKGVGGLIVGCNKGVDVGPKLLGAAEAGGAQGLSAEQAEPDFHLIEPGGVRRRVVKMDLGMVLPPAVAFGLVNIQIIQDDMQGATGVSDDQTVHEVEEFRSSATPVVTGFDQSAGHFQRRKQRGCAVPLVIVRETGESSAIGEAQPALSPFQGLDVRFFIHRQYERVFGRVQVKPDHIGGFLREAGIGGDTPTAAALQTDAVAAQHAPDVMAGNIAHSPAHQRAIPAGIPGRGRGVELLQDTLLRSHVIVGGLARTRGIQQARQALAQKAIAPFADRGRAGVMGGGDCLITSARGSIQDDLGTEDVPASALAAAHDALQLLPFGVTQKRGLCPHEGHYIQYAN